MAIWIPPMIWSHRKIRRKKSNLVGGGDELKNGGEWSRWQNHGKMRDDARLEQRSLKGGPKTHICDCCWCKGALYFGKLGENTFQCQNTREPKTRIEMKIILEKLNNTKTIHSKVAKWSYNFGRSSKILNINEMRWD